VLDRLLIQGHTIQQPRKEEKMQGNPNIRDQARLENIARELRLDILESTSRAGSGHPSSSFSAVEILTVLFFAGILKYHPEEPWAPDRDRFIMSKGHAAPLLYAVLAKAGYFNHDEIYRLRQKDSPVQGHPIHHLMPGVEATTGSLGQGLSLGVGHLLAARLSGLRYRVFVLLGDGECEAGQVWEAAMAAAHFKTNRLVAILDYNKYQETGPISREMALEPLVDKWQSFGWHVLEADGHDMEDLIEQLEGAVSHEDAPSIIIAHTVKGKGVSFVEADFTFHGRALKGDQVERARKEIEHASG
jgi:transketolase